MPPRLIAAAAAALALAAGGCSTGGDPSPEEVVAEYLDARADGDAERACAQLTEGQRWELVARVTRDLTRSDARHCPRHVLRRSPNSTATRPALDLVAGGPLFVSQRRAPDMVVVASREHRSAWLELIREDGRWRIDGQAAEKVSFAHQCPAAGLGDRESCVCAFEWMRRWNVEIYEPDDRPAAQTQELVARALEGCGGHAPGGRTPGDPA